MLFSPSHTSTFGKKKYINFFDKKQKIILLINKKYTWLGDRESMVTLTHYLMVPNKGVPIKTIQREFLLYRVAGTA